MSGFLVSTPWALCSVLVGGSHGPTLGWGSTTAFQRQCILNSTQFVSTRQGQTDPELSAEAGHVPARLRGLEVAVTATAEGLELANDSADDYRD